jgi:zona occludens toxin
MAINTYCGLMGSGKSYEVVSSVVVPAVAAGRRVVSNIAGLNSDAVREYCSRKYSVELDLLGSVVIVTDDQVRSDNFFPAGVVASEGASESIVLPGDLVAIDEAYKIWGGDCKIPNAHKVFFREHRHYTHPETGVSCDLVLMTQDIGDLHRTLKVVIGSSFKTHKAKGVGLNNLYTITMWEGWKQVAKYIVKDWTKTYDPEIFPLYKSYSGSKQGRELNADARQNIFDRRMAYKIGILVLIVCFVMWRLFNFWWGKTHPADVKAVASVPTGAASVPAADGVSGASATPPRGAYSSELRIVGRIVIDGMPFVLVSGPSGTRAEFASGFTGDGLRQVGTVDGEKVSRFSGPAATTSEARK